MIQWQDSGDYVVDQFSMSWFSKKNWATCSIGGGLFCKAAVKSSALEEEGPEGWYTVIRYRMIS